MNRRRRRLLQASGVAVAGAAGCLNVADGEERTNDSADEGGDGGSDGSGEALELDFGEGAEFTDGEDVALQVGMANPRLVETAPVVRDAEIYVDSPESRPSFLFVDVRVANEGSSPIEPPRGLYFEADGETVERTFVRTPGRKYRDVGELSPSERVDATVAFPSPAEADAGTVSLRFQTLLESPPARWTFDFADLPRESSDLARDELGETYTVEAGEYAYEFTPTGARETSAYAYGDGQEHAAPERSTFVLVDARAENVGSKPVKLPTPYDVRLDADGSVARGTKYKDGEARYQGRVEPYQPGESQAGTFLFEVPESASSYALRLAIGNKTFVTWPVEPEGN